MASPNPYQNAPQSNNSSAQSTVTPGTAAGPTATKSWSKRISEIDFPFPDGLKVKEVPITQPQTPTSQPPRPPSPQHQPQHPPQGYQLQNLPPATNTSTATTTRKFLHSVDTKKPFLTGQPRIRVGDDPGVLPRLSEYLHRAHLTTEIDTLLRYMRYIFVQTPSYRHIAPLHHQKAREREVIVDEHPGLHLVWYYQVIFVKPIPAYFFSPSFWSYIETAENDVFRAALGFMRSYNFLIQYETDYLMACEKRLIPKLPLPNPPPATSHSENKEGNCCACCQKNDHPDDKRRHPTYEEFCAFLAPFESVIDKECPRRFHYGEIRLTRINRTALFFRLKLAYFHIYPQWGSFLQHVLAPVITVFAVATVILNCMQVSLAAIDMLPGADEGGWPRFIDVSRWFPIVVLIFITAILGAGVFALLGMVVNDGLFAEKTRQGKKKGVPNAGEKSHGIIW